jgi:hypothetical protein
MKWSNIAIYSFVILCFIVLGNLNGLTYALTSKVAFFSPIILISAITIIFFSRKPKKINISVQLFLLFYISYLFISTCSLILFPEFLHIETDLFLLYKGYLSSILLILAVYFIVCELLTRFGTSVIYKIFNFLSYLMVIPLFFTIFGDEIGLTKGMIYINNFGERQIGIFTNPNTTGLHANLLLVMAFFNLLQKDKFKLFWLVIIFSCFYSSFLTLSRSAILVSFFNLMVFILYLFFKFRNLTRENRLYLVLYLVLFGISGYLIISKFNDIMDGLTINEVNRIEQTLSFAQGNINKETTSERTDLIEFVLPRLKESLLIGLGLGSYHRLVGYDLGVHNTGVLILGESGFLPFLIFVIFSINYFYSSFRVKDLKLRYLFISLFMVYLFIPFITSHNALDERMSNLLLCICISSIDFENY